VTDIDSVVENETTVPLLPCSDVSSTLEFLQALGFQVTYEMTRPYLYLAFRWRGVLTARAEIAIALGETEIARKIRDAVDPVTLGPGDAESLADELDSVRRLEAWLTDTDR